MKNVKSYLAGKKTYIVAAGAILTAFGAWLGDALSTKELIESIFAALGAATLRAGVKKAELVLLAGLLLTMPACARFTTKQTDVSHDTQGKPTRQVSTKATAYALMSSKSELTKFRASQTDKSQTASVGTLNQEANATTNLTSMIEAIVRGVASGLNPAK